MCRKEVGTQSAQVMVAQEVAKEREVLAGQGERREIQLQVSELFSNKQTNVSSKDVLATGGEENENEDVFVDWLEVTFLPIQSSPKIVSSAI